MDQSKRLSNTQHKQTRVDREGKRHSPVFSRLDLKRWNESESNTQWIVSIQIKKREKKCRVADVEKKEESVKSIPVKEVVNIHEKKTVNEKKEVTKKTSETPKSSVKKVSVKDRLKSNPLFRFK